MDEGDMLLPVRGALVEVDRILEDEAAMAKGPLRTMISHAAGTGKRFRPALVILSGRMLGADEGLLIQAAAALEMMHIATLVHDDLIDQVPVRRGRQALCSIWPANAVVLAGDYLLSRAIVRVADLGDPALIRVFAGAVTDVCNGEIGEIYADPEYCDLRNQYFGTIRDKTASLCAAGTVMAGILAHAEEERIGALRQYGYHLGTAFQIADDVLDVTGWEEETGKPAGTDLRCGILTLPAIIYMERSGDLSIFESVRAGRMKGEMVNSAIRSIRNSRAVEEALEEAGYFARMAQQCLDGMPDNLYRHELHALAGFVVERTG